jgi:hypothetical protein
MPGSRYTHGTAFEAFEGVAGATTGSCGPGGDSCGSWFTLQGYDDVTPRGKPDAIAIRRI